MCGVCVRGVREDFAYSVVYTRKQISEKKNEKFFSHRDSIVIENRRIV